MIPIGQWLAERSELPSWNNACAGPPANAAGGGPEDLEKLVEEAFARGKREAQQEFEEQLQPARLEARQRCQELLNDTRDRWLQIHVQPLGVKFSAAIEEMEGRLSDVLARVLKPFIAKAVMQRTLGEFKGVIAGHFADAAPCPMRLRATQDILHTLGQALKESGLTITLEEAESSDWILEAGTTVFESQASKWLAAIEAESND